MTAAELKLDEYIFAMFVGDPNAGKTTAAALFPKPMLVFDSDYKFQQVLGHPLIKGQSWLKDIEIIRPRTIKEIDERLTLLQLKSKKDFPYATILDDSLTAQADLFINEAFQWTKLLVNKEGEAGSFHKKLGPKDLPGFDEWAFETKCFTDLIMALKVLP